jgi:hypothetical protein
MTAAMTAARGTARECSRWQPHVLQGWWWLVYISVPQHLRLCRRWHQPRAARHCLSR